MKIKLQAFRKLGPHQALLIFADSEAAKAVAHHCRLCAVVEVAEVAGVTVMFTGPDVTFQDGDMRIGKAARVEEVMPRTKPETHVLHWLTAKPVGDAERIRKSAEWMKQKGKTNG